MEDMGSSMTAVRFPAMRANLKAYAESLADEEYQTRVWVGQETPPSHDTFTDIVHFFYDDTKLAEDPDRCVGLFLRDHSEVRAARKIVDALDAVFAEFGTSRPDKDYVTATAWPRVVAAARVLLGIMDRLDKAKLENTV